MAIRPTSLFKLTKIDIEKIKELENLVDSSLSGSEVEITCNSIEFVLKDVYETYMELSKMAKVAFFEKYSILGWDEIIVKKKNLVFLLKTVRNGERRSFFSVPGGNGFR